jgi:hypothetical protein
MNEHIQNLTEAQAKLLLEYAMLDLHNAIYDPHARYDAACIAWLTQTIEKLSKENTTQS